MNLGHPRIYPTIHTQLNTQKEILDNKQSLPQTNMENNSNFQNLDEKKFSEKKKFTKRTNHSDKELQDFPKNYYSKIAK